MATFIECKIVDAIDKNRNNDPVTLRVDHISVIAPIWNEDEVWIYTDIQMLCGTTWRVNHVTDQLEEAMRSEAFSAIAPQD